MHTEIIDPEHAFAERDKHAPSGIILAGGPSSVFADEGLTLSRDFFDTEIPVLGICYGNQLMSHVLGGTVKRGDKGEYGPAFFTRSEDTSVLLRGVPKAYKVWASHFDEVQTEPLGATVLGSTDKVPMAAFEDPKNKRYGVQFHPEVEHTEYGARILENFAISICGEEKKEHEINVDELVASVRHQICDGRAVCGLSGGIDSAVAAVLVQKAIGNNLTCVFVDNGLLRQGEVQSVREMFEKNFNLNLKIVDAREKFLTALQGITDPEEKRKIIGELFVRVFEETASEIDADFLVQGTIYPDVIESKGTKNADVIKTHHNVGGLPDDIAFELVEPLRNFYKDEVRNIAKKLDFPHELIHRHVFPGPGLAIRIIGDVTEEKLDILRRSDAIVTDELKESGEYDAIWMGFAIFAGVKSTGVQGDERRYGETIALRIVTSNDAMTAEWARLPYEVLATISNRIISEVPEVTRVVYDITTKPPATMEWE